MICVSLLRLTSTLQKELLKDYSAKTPLIIEEYHKDSVECDGKEDLLSWVLKWQQVCEWQYVVAGGTDNYKDSL